MYVCMYSQGKQKVMSFPPLLFPTISIKACCRQTLNKYLLIWWDWPILSSSNSLSCQVTEVSLTCDKTRKTGFPGVSVINNLPINAGNIGSIPDPGRLHMTWNNYGHAPQLLSLCSRVKEPQLLSPHAATTEAHGTLEPVLCNREANPMRCLGTVTESSPQSLQLEKVCGQQQGPSTAKNK